MGVNLPLAQLRPRDETYYVSRNRTVLATARDGFIHGGAEGLFVSQTRMLCVYSYRINGHSPEPVGISNLEENSQIAYYVVESPTADKDLFRGALGPGGRAATEAIELRLLRFAGDGMAETVELRNHTLRTAPLTLELEIDADFADANEVHDKRAERGGIERHWHAEGNPPELEWVHTAEHDYDHQGNRGHATLRRTVKVAFLDAASPPVYDAARKCIRFQIELAAHDSWRCRVLVSANIDGTEYRPVKPDHGIASDTVYKDRYERFLAESTQAEISTPGLAFVVHRTLTQARNDLLGLRLYDLDREDGGWTLAAGLPVYIALFGRDTLTAAWQSALLSDKLMRGTLPELAATQAREQNDWRDAQPGRFVHQMETGPLASLLYNPNGRYYGGLTGPGFYPVALSNLWHWTGDRSLVRRFVDPALKGLAFLDQYAKNEKGFYAYQKRSEQGVKNQAWKDSYDAIVYPDGSQVKDPIAPTEFQAFVIASKVRMSELMWGQEDRDLARKLFGEAMELRDRFNDCFWMEDEGCFGMGLDPSGRLIRSVGSETAHAVAAGAISRDRAERAVERLFRPDMFSGWGVRTLSSRHPAFNPFSYHRGSVWPAEQAAFAMGLMRYGLHARLHQLTKAQFEAASIFEHCRLPELFSGHQRDDDHPIPALYPHADSPQAWSASSVWCMLQALLGIFPYAPLATLFVDPHLPEWLPEIRLRHLHVGAAVVDLEFRRDASGSTDYRVADLRGKLHVVRQASPWSLTADFGERMRDAITSLLPGH